jgi:hypothetical protein
MAAPVKCSPLILIMASMRQASAHPIEAMISINRLCRTPS